MLQTAVAFDVRFSITVRQDKRIRAAIETIDEQAWQPIPYWLSSPEVSGADVAETTYTAFTGTHALPVRLIVCRVRPTPGSQLALFTTGSYHAFVTDRPGQMLELEADHRRHAIVEQTIAELKNAGLAHLPSGHFMASAAWLALAVMAHNLARAVGHLAGPDLQRATTATPAARGWLGRELARWQRLAGRSRGLCSAGFPIGCATPVAMVSVLRFQLPPVEPCVRFSRTRLTDVLHRRCSA